MPGEAALLARTPFSLFGSFSTGGGSRSPELAVESCHDILWVGASLQVKSLAVSDLSEESDGAASERPRKQSPGGLPVDTGSLFPEQVSINWLSGSNLFRSDLSMISRLRYWLTIDGWINSDELKQSSSPYLTGED